MYIKLNGKCIAHTVVCSFKSQVHVPGSHNLSYEHLGTKPLSACIQNIWVSILVRSSSS